MFAFLRESDPRRALELRLQLIAPVLASAGIALRGDPPSAVELDHAQVGAFMRDGAPRLDELGVPVLLPRRVGRDRQPPQRQPRRDDPGRPVERPSDPRGDRVVRLAARDRRRELTEEELAELAAAKEPLFRLRGRWHALRRAEVERALRFLERRERSSACRPRRGPSAGLETDEAGVELGEVRLDAALDELLADAGERRYRSLATPQGMRHDLFPFQERGHGWLRLLGDLGVGAILADDMGLGKTVQAIARSSPSARSGRRRSAPRSSSAR